MKSHHPFFHALLVAVCLPAATLAQGSLTPPPGEPGPTMRTLQQIEARIPVNTLPGAEDAVHVISEPGNYYLSGDIQGEAGKHGISITTGDVTIDLMGFTVRGVPGSLNGIHRVWVLVGEDEPPQFAGIHVNNGKIAHWDGHGLHLAYCRNVSVTGIDVRHCRNAGISVVGYNSRIVDCDVSHIAGSGIVVGDFALVRGCRVAQLRPAPTPQPISGIRLASGSVENCVVASVDGTGGSDNLRIAGIEVLYTGSVRDCDVNMITTAKALSVGIAALHVVHCNVRWVAAVISSGRAIGIQIGGTGSTLSGSADSCQVLQVMGHEAYGIAIGPDPWNNRLTANGRVQRCFVHEVMGHGGRAIGILARHVADSSVIDVNSSGPSTAGHGDGVLVRGGVVERTSVRSVRQHGIYLDGSSTARDCHVHLAANEGNNTSGAGIRAVSQGNRIEGCHVSNSYRGFTVDGGINHFIRNISRANTHHFPTVAATIAPVITSVGAADTATNPLANIAY
ncbi:MAG: hypothetical protein EA425_06605 [Puniceicoccaceae bacterium]|nr:MAG: hypothetical protein EA425_06605 [Puniceicoccaceae bacterium]